VDSILPSLIRRRGRVAEGGGLLIRQALSPLLTPFRQCVCLQALSTTVRNSHPPRSPPFTIGPVPIRRQFRCQFLSRNVRPGCDCTGRILSLPTASTRAFKCDPRLRGSSACRVRGAICINASPVRVRAGERIRGGSLCWAVRTATVEDAKATTAKSGARL
jgi:hypothetical protein